MWLSTYPVICVVTISLTFAVSVDGFAQENYILRRHKLPGQILRLEWLDSVNQLMVATKGAIRIIDQNGKLTVLESQSIVGEYLDVCVANQLVYFTEYYDDRWYGMSAWQPFASSKQFEIFRIPKWVGDSDPYHWRSIGAIAASATSGLVAFGLTEGGLGGLFTNQSKWYVYSIPGHKDKGSFSNWLPGKVADMGFSADGQMLAYATESGFDTKSYVGVVKLPNFSEVWASQKYSKQVTSVCFSFDGNLLFVSTENKLVDVYSATTGDLIKQLIGHTDDVRNVACNPNNSYLATAGKDKSVIIWDINQGTIVKQLIGHTKGVNQVAFNSNGTKLASGGDDKSCILWDFDKIVNEHLAAQLKVAETKAEEERRRLAEPSNLALSVKFDDSHSILPNNGLDAGEAALLKISLQNSGKGSGFDVSLLLSSDQPLAELQPKLDVGEIAPSAIKEFSLPIKLAVDAQDGTAKVEIQAKEKRGYDSRPIQLQIPVRHLDKPALAITSFTLNDGASGLASGNGNGIAENGETVEVTAFIKNSGVGPSINTSLNLSTASSGAEIRQGAVRLGTIAPGETRQGKVVVAIPRTYTGKELRLAFAARDTIGASQITKEHVLPMSTRTPVIAFDSRFLDSRGVQVDEVSNGSNYVLEIVSRNEGQIGARSVQTAVSASTGVNLTSTSASVGDLAAGATAAQARFNFSLPRNYNASPPRFTLRLTQADFPEVVQPFDIPFRRKAPNLVVREVVNTTDGNADIQQSENVDIDLVIDNQGDLDAENVEVSLDFTHTGINFPERSKNLGRITAGGRATHRFSFLVKTGAAVGPLNGQLRIRQADGFPGIDKPMNYAINAIGAQIVTVTPTVQPTVGQRTAPSPRANTPPVVFLSLKNLASEGKSYDPFVNLEIQIQDDKSMLAVEPEIRVNGKLQLKEQGLRGLGLQEREAKEVDRKIRLTRRVELSEGMNDIEVRVYDSDNEMGVESTQVEYLAQRTDIWAIVVGVGDYQHEQIDDLKYAAADAQSFYDFLRSPEGGSVQTDHIKLLLNREATRENVLRDMDWITSRALDGDLVMIYMAMHGVAEQGELYLLGSNSDPSNLIGTGIKKSELESLVRRKNNKVVWFADACHSGTVGEDPQVAMRASRASVTNRLLSEISKARSGVAMFMSATAAEYSQESSKWGGGHGVFTYFLLKGLRGEADRNKDNFVSLPELYDFVSRQVTEATEGKQNPVLRGDYDRELKVSAVK